MSKYTGLFRLFPLVGKSEDGFVSNDKDLVRASVVNLISTHKGSRVYDPDYGTNIHKLVFELNIQRVRNIAKVEITEIVEKYEPRAKIIDINAYPGTGKHTDTVVMVVKLLYVEFDETEELEIRLKKDNAWISEEGVDLDPIEEWFKNNK